MHRFFILFGLIGLLGQLQPTESARAMTVNITVSDAPKLISVIEEINNPEDTNTTITCSVGSGQLQGLTFEWFRENERIPTRQAGRIVIETPSGNYLSNLRIFGLKPSDSGTYSCLAKNRFGQDRISTRLNVRVQLKWIKEPIDNQVSVGKALFIPCKADGKPEPIVQWRRLGESNSSVSQIFGPELRFSSIQPDDSGYYECRAGNGVEEDLVSRIKIDVLGK